MDPVQSGEIEGVQTVNDPAVNAVHKLIYRATKAETTLDAILAAYATMDHGTRVSLDNLCAPLNTALVRAEGATKMPAQNREDIAITGEYTRSARSYL